MPLNRHWPNNNLCVFSFPPDTFSRIAKSFQHFPPPSRHFFFLSDNDRNRNYFLRFLEARRRRCRRKHSERKRKSKVFSLFPWRANKHLISISSNTCLKDIFRRFSFQVPPELRNFFIFENQFFGGFSGGRRKEERSRRRSWRECNLPDFLLMLFDRGRTECAWFGVVHCKRQRKTLKSSLARSEWYGSGLIRQSIKFASKHFLHSPPRIWTYQFPRAVVRTFLRERARTFSAAGHRRRLAPSTADGIHIRGPIARDDTRACPATFRCIRRPEPVVVYLMQRDGRNDLKFKVKSH